MASKNESWGLEIGATAIKALKMERVDDTSVRMVDFAVVQHPKVLSTPGVEANEVIRLGLQQLVGQVDLTKGSLAISVPGQSAFARFCKLPPVEPKKVPDIVRFEAMQQIPVPLEEVEWDFQTFVATDSPDVGVGIFAMRKDNLKDRLQLLADFGLTPDVVTLSPLAVYNAMAWDLEFAVNTPGTIIVDIGTASTDIVIAEPGRMWVRTFPMGGHQFTEALVQAFNLSYPKAEKLKREAEQTEHARRVFQEMRPVFTDLATEIQRSIGYYQSLHKDAKLTRVIGVGSTFRLPGLRKYFKQQLGLEVYRVEEFKRIKPPENTSTERTTAFNDLSLNMCTSYGLCLQALGLNACGGNLMPVSVMRDTAWKGKVPLFATAAALAVAGSAAFFARPVIDSMKVKDRPIDKIVGEALALANTQKKEAEAAGVVGGAKPDFAVANLIDVTSRRDFYPHIVNDVGLMMAAANAKQGAKPGAPVFDLASLATTYEAPDEKGTDDLAKKPKVRCVLELNTDIPEARRFAQDAVAKWLRDNEKRDGVPYRIVLMDESLAVREGDGPAPGMNEGPAAGPSPAVPSAPPVDERGSGRGRMARPGSGPGPMPPPGRSGMGAPPPVAPPDGGTVMSGDDQAAQGELERLSPVSVDQRARGRMTVHIEWLAVEEGSAK